MTARPSRPQALPEYRNATVANDMLWASLAMVGEYTGKTDFEHADVIRDWMSDAQLWWVGADALDLVETAAPTMPPATLTDELCPDKAGFVFFERPVRSGHDADNPEITIDVDALLWLPTQLGSAQVANAGQGEIDWDYNCVSIVSWQDQGLGTTEVHSGGRLIGEASRPRFPMALGRADWPFGHDTDQALPVDVAPGVLDSIIEDRRLLAAIWQLSSQAGLTEAVDRQPDRATVKRLTRARKPVPDVRCINLAPHRRGPRDGDSGGSQREYSRRWIVEGHWRQQACGPQWSQRRPVFIAPYVKGPDDKPLVVPESVKVWK